MSNPVSDFKSSWVKLTSLNYQLPDRIPCTCACTFLLSHLAIAMANALAAAIALTAAIAQQFLSPSATGRANCGSVGGFYKIDSDSNGTSLIALAIGTIAFFAVRQICFQLLHENYYTAEVTSL